MNTRMQAFPSVVAAVSVAALLITQTATAQQAVPAAPQQDARLVLPLTPVPAMNLDLQGYSTSLSTLDDEYSDDAPAATTSAPQQAPTATAPAGVLAQLSSAHKVLLTNAGAKAGFGVDSSAVFNDIDRELRSWGRFEMVTSPQDADLIFELREGTHVSDISAADDPPQYAVTGRTMVMTISDAQSGVILWRVTSPLYSGLRASSSARWLKISEDNLVSRVKQAVNQPLTPQEITELNTYPKSHVGLLLLGFLGVSAGMALGGYALFQHEVANGKAQQDAFCKAHNIPQDMCAGG